MRNNAYLHLQNNAVSKCMELYLGIVKIFNKFLIREFFFPKTLFILSKFTNCK